MTEACNRGQHWSAEPIIQQVDADGELATDVHIAALAISRGAAVASLDNDFARFPGLRWINPLLET